MFTMTAPSATPPRSPLDRFIRRFQFASYFTAVVALYAICATALGLAFAPALWFVERAMGWAGALPAWLAWPAAGVGIAVAFFLAGFALLVIVPIYNLVLPTRVEHFKGAYYTIAALPWFIHNALFYLVRFTFLPFVTLTPFGLWFLKAMGMKVGKRAYINTELISDPQLITLGDDVVIGGSATIFAHYGGGGNLVIEPVQIRSGATIGIRATIMGDVIVGAGATILPNSVLLPGSRVGDGETWGGVPARPIARAEMDRFKALIRGETPPVGVAAGSDGVSSGPIGGDFLPR
jgi:acetyltransferase-like isoleucine patch superfamily enzyme